MWAEGGIFLGVHSRGNGRVRLLGIFQRNPKKEGGDSICKGENVWTGENLNPLSVFPSPFPIQ